MAGDERRRRDIAGVRPGGRLSILIAAVFWGTTGTFSAFAPAGADPASVGAARIAVGGAMLVAVATATGAWRSGDRWPPVATAVAALGIAAYQPFFFAGVARTGVAVATVVAIGSAPAWAGLFALAARGERPGGRWAATTAMAVAGCGLLVVGGGGVRVAPSGVLAALAAGACYGAYATAFKRLVADRPYAAAMAGAFGLGALLLLPVLLASDRSWLSQPEGIAVTLGLGVVATAVAYLLFARGLAEVPVATAATLSLMEPVTAAALGVVLLGERPGPVAWIGIGLVLGGLVLLAGGRRRSVLPAPGR